MKNKTIIVLCGDADSGKSKSLSTLINVLANEDVITPLEGDWKAYICHGGCGIVVTTKGDGEKDERENIEYMEEKAQWLIAVTAAQPRAQTIKEIIDHCCKPENDIVSLWIPKLKDGGSDEETNIERARECAKNLLKVIDDIIGEIPCSEKLDKEDGLEELQPYQDML